MAGEFKWLFEPINIGKVEIKNRVAMAPMGIGGLADLDGSPGPRAVDYYIERARGGVGLIITGMFKVEDEIEPFRTQFRLVSEQSLGSFAEMAEAVHSLGAKIFVQLSAGFGRVAFPTTLRSQPVSAYGVPYYWDPRQTCREMRTEEIEKLIRAFGNAADILGAAGVDGVELHGHEGYLFDQFATSIWNGRTDKYGGDLEGRLRLPIEVLREIKGRAGMGFSVQYRFGLKHYMKALNSGALPGEQFVEAGRDIEEGLEMARMLEAAGFDALHIDAGCYDSWYWPHPPVYQQPGAMVNMAAEAKKFVKIPVITVGKLSTPELAERILAEGKADIVAIGKGLLADPLWVRKAEEGKQDRIRPCIGCHDGCMGRITRGKPLSCAVNPATGRERSYRLERAEKARNVMVVGSGPAGLEAARVALLRGHRAVLYEKGYSLGGNLLAASVPGFKRDLGRLLDWYIKELENLGLVINTGREVSAEVINSENPDVTILATGSSPIIPNIPGIRKEKVFTAADILLGKKEAQGKVLVLGGGLIGCETALWLAEQGREITIIEALNDLLIAGIPVQHMNRMMLLDLLKYRRIDVFTSTSVAEVTDEGVILQDRHAVKKEFAVDSIVLAVGLKPDQHLYQALRGQIPNLFSIGDSRKTQNIMNSIWDAYEVVRMI